MPRRSPLRPYSGVRITSRGLRPYAGVRFRSCALIPAVLLAAAGLGATVGIWH
jgi:hypothetical protein